MTDPRTLLAFAETLADAAEPIARRWFRAPVAVDTKSDRTPVTEADRAIERELRARIRAAFPAHGVLGEEEGPDRADAEVLWVLDPIDGTKAFASGNPLFGTLIGVLHRGVPVAGVLAAHALGERWTAAKGGGAFHGGKAVRVRASRPLADAVAYCTTAEQPKDPAANEPLRALRRRVRWTSFGGDCCAYGFLASGFVDLVADAGLAPYDWAALVPIVEEAGGVLLDWRGEPLTLRSDGRVVAATSRALAEEAFAALRGPA